MATTTTTTVDTMDALRRALTNIVVESRQFANTGKHRNNWLKRLKEAETMLSKALPA